MPPTGKVYPTDTRFRPIKITHAKIANVDHITTELSTQFIFVTQISQGNWIQ